MALLDSVLSLELERSMLRLTERAIGCFSVIPRDICR